MKKLFILFASSFYILIITATAQVYGCPDPMATNYNAAVTYNNGSCLYNSVTIAPTSSFNLAGNLSETSGLIRWNNQIWTHNDNGDINIYGLDTINGNLTKSYKLSNTINNDWEEISQDNNYIYIGDFGNNQNGNRTNLKILRIAKNSILTNLPEIDTINFSYSNQNNFTPTGSNKTDFDCEAFIVSEDSIFLFTKQWISNKTSLYAVSKNPGTHIAKLKSTFDVQGLITGAVYLESKNLISLCGYTSTLQPFVYLLYDFSNSDYFGGNKRKISLSIPFHQIEGIASANGLKYYVSNENFTLAPLINIVQKIHTLDLSTFLGNYFNSLMSASGIKPPNHFLIYPNPVNDFITIKADKNFLPVNYFFTNQLGQIVLKGKLTMENTPISFSDLSAGVYMFKIGEENKESFKVIKK